MLRTASQAPATTDPRDFVDAGSATSLDAPLVLAIAELRHLDTGIANAFSENPGKDLDDIAEAIALNDRRFQVLTTLREVPAQTTLGVEAKSQALRTPDLINDYEQHSAIAVSLAEDIARLAEARVAAEREPFNVVLAAEGTRLFKLACREFDDQVAALRDRGVDGAELEKATRQLRRDLRLDALFELTDDAPKGARGNLATWPSAPAPLVADEADPVLAAIAASRAALDAFAAACHAPDADTQAGEARTSAASELSQGAWRSLLSVSPRTVAGVQALASYVADHIRSYGCWNVEGDADALTLFGTIGAALTRADVGAGAVPVSRERAEGRDPSRDRVLDDALTRHRIADRDWMAAANAADTVLIKQAGGDTSEAAMAPLDAAAGALGKEADQAWRDIFRLRPSTFEGLWSLLHHIQAYRAPYEEIPNPPDIVASLYASVHALRSAPSLNPPSYDLGLLSVADLDTLAEVCHLQAEGLNTAGYLPLCSANGLCTPLGEIFDREWNRMGILRDLAATEIAARRPADDEERDDRLRTLLRQDLLANGCIEPALLAEAVAAWGQR